MSSNNGKKFTLSTDTDLHMDMLADHSKLKIFPNVVENKQSNISISGDAKSDASDTNGRWIFVFLVEATFI